MAKKEDSWDYCDRSPCKRLIVALGAWIYGDNNGGYVAVAHKSYSKISTETILAPIRYCPFCGTRLDQLEFKQGPVVYVAES